MTEPKQPAGDSEYVAGVTDPTALFDLSGRTAIVTGGSRGLGRQAVLAFARAGADVVIASRRAESCEALAAEVREKTGRKALAHPCHVGNWDELDGLVDAAYEAFDSVDILVNNAGMSPVYDSPIEITEALWDKVIDVNLKGAFRLSALVGTRMVADGRGSIINISSVGAVDPSGIIIPYAAAKAGLNAMTVAYARALGPAVRVNSILPGTFLTDISEHWDRERADLEMEGFALQREAEPEEIVGTMLYLASDASSYTTGAMVRVDGGYLQMAGTKRVTAEPEEDAR
jgi:NAD(P)-dependent dehydrogenase (short-subunit alcohol dehydrogenase family)